MSKASKIKGSYYKEKLPPASSEKITFPFGIIVRQRCKITVFLIGIIILFYNRYVK